MPNLWLALPVAALIAGLGLHFSVLRVMRGQYRKKLLHPPSGEDTVSAPGRSLLQKIDLVTIELKAHRLGVLVQPVLLLALAAVYRKFNPRIDLQFLITSAVACGIVFFYCLWNLIEGLAARRRYRLDSDAKVAVGQALDDLASRGYHVLHGFTYGHFDIDHVVVGPKGVFTVETKAWSRTGAKDRAARATVTYNGHVLFFPKGTDEETVARAENQAELLSNWLSEATGEPISARAVVAIPGWLVKRTSSEGVPVVNPNQFPSLFEHIQSRPLSGDQIDCIAEKLRRQLAVVS